MALSVRSIARINWSKRSAVLLVWRTQRVARWLVTVAATVVTNPIMSNAKPKASAVSARRLKRRWSRLNVIGIRGGKLSGLKKRGRNDRSGWAQPIILPSDFQNDEGFAEQWLKNELSDVEHWPPPGVRPS